MSAQLLGFKRAWSHCQEIKRFESKVSACCTPIYRYLGALLMLEVSCRFFCRIFLDITQEYVSLVVLSDAKCMQ